MKNGKNIRGALSYNEAKVREGKAELILSSRYGCDATELSFSQKLKRFTDLNDKCVTSSFNTVHISLNFSPADCVDTETMQLIARDYMQQLGFEKQPYLVYRHDDTAHPHLHIVTTPVKANGRTIDLHNLVQRKSEPARKSIEDEYHLVKAEGRRQAEGISPIEVKSVIYGKVETKQTISQIVRNVADGWRFTNLEEYNVILKRYGVMADNGKAGDRMHNHEGLQYCIINNKGEQVSVGIKASSIYTKPTIKNLELRFARNVLKKQSTLDYTAKTIQYGLTQTKTKIECVRWLLEKKIQVVETDNKTYFIDHRNKTVTKTEELGLRSNPFDSLEQPQAHLTELNLSLLQKLFENEYTGPDLAAAFLKKKRKKKK
jgi:hypothetical protein